MACCNSTTSIPTKEQQIIKAVNDKLSKDVPYIRSITKSNRAPAGSVAKECPQCGTKTIISVCPICSTPLR